MIEQLGARTGEPAARSALAAATTGADYFLTRALAATALEAFPGPEAEAALVAALADTAASVRQAVLTALGKRGAMGAAPAVRAHWEHEASDEARAAALTALAQLDPAAARGLLPAALEIPSYQDGISNAAAFAAVGLGDTTLVPAIARAAERTSGGVYALAAFGRNGSGAALDRLGELALSRRAGLRRRALEAFRFAVAPEQARVRLTALLAAAPEDAIRRDLAEALARLR